MGQKLSAATRLRAPRATTSQLEQRVRREAKGTRLFEFETPDAWLFVAGVTVSRMLIPATSEAEALALVGAVSWTAPKYSKSPVLVGPIQDEQASGPALLLSKEGLCVLACDELAGCWTPLCDRIQAGLDRKLTWRGGSVLRGVPDYVLIDGPGARLAGVFNEAPRAVARQRERRLLPSEDTLAAQWGTASFW